MEATASVTVLLWFGIRTEAAIATHMLQSALGYWKQMHHFLSTGSLVWPVKRPSQMRSAVNKLFTFYLMAAAAPPSTGHFGKLQQDFPQPPTVQFSVTEITEQ